MFSALEKALGELRQTLIAGILSLRENLLDIGLETSLTPVVAGCHFRASRLSITRGFEQRFGGSLVVSGMIAVRQRNAA